MKFLNIAIFALAATLITSKSYSQVSIHARVGIGAPPPVVVYEPAYPVHHSPYYGREEVVVVQPRRGYGYYDRGPRDRYERFEGRRHRDYHEDRRDFDRGYAGRDYRGY